MPVRNHARSEPESILCDPRLPAAADYFLKVMAEVDVEPHLEVLRQYRAGTGELEDAMFAARVLAAKKELRAVPELLALLRGSRADDPRRHDFATAIGRFGDLALEPLLDLWDSTDTEPLRDMIAAALSLLRLHDPRILEILVDRLRVDSARGALLLEEYGDAAALPALHRALGVLDLDRTSDLRMCLHILTLAGAILDLDDRLSPTERFKVAVAERLQRQVILAE
jgi:hypothetical protein